MNIKFHRTPRASQLVVLLLLSILNPQLSTALAQGTAFTYQGRLSDGANPANGTYDLQFAIYDSTNLPGVLIAGPRTNSATAVSNGLFTVTIDFGAGVFAGPDRWLEIAARTNGAGSFSTLSPRQNLAPAPYAIFAGNAAASASFSGPVSLSQLPPSVALLNSNQVFTGAVSFSNPSNSFTGNGTALNNVRFTTLDGTGVESLRFGNLVFQNFLSVTSVPVASGDMNGDGRVDFIGYDNASGSLLVMTNNGKSSFGLLGSYPGVSTGNIIVADINGDGKLDVVTTAAGNSVSVFTNTGSGTLAFASSTPTGPIPRAIATADFNNDGWPDVVTANASDATLTVLTNNRSAGFGLFVTLTGAGPNVWAAIAADVNGDGRPDIISSKVFNIVNGNLTVFTNNGGNGFVLASTPITGVNPLAIAAADLNGDGHVDLVTADYGAFGVGNTISVLINDGSGNFSLSSTPSVGTATGPALITTADVNGDGKIDVLCTTEGTNATGTFSVSVLTNDGTGFLNLSTVLSNEESVVPADINADGYTDLIGSISATNGNSINPIPDVWLNEPFGISFHIPVTAESSLVVNGVATLNNPANSFSGNGTGLTGLNAGNISSGTLSDARLSSNVALRASANTFTAANTFNGNVGISTPSPQAQFNVNGTARIDATTAPYSEGLTLNFPTDMPGSGYGGIDFHNAARGGAYSASTIKWGIYYNYAPEFGVGGNGFSFVQNNVNTRLYISTNGNVGIGTLSPTNKLHVAGGVSATVFVTTSDRNAKENFARVSPLDVLEKVAALPITRWTFKEMPGQEHLGPMAQDFHAAFNLGGGDTGIATVDEEGVALAAIQGLNEKVEVRSEKAEDEIQKLKAENLALKQRLAALEKIILRKNSN